MHKNINIALVGNPNCGKTALFNALTGSKQRVANYSGVTIEKKHGYFITKKHINCTLVDLPGTYSLRSHSPDELITRDVVLGTFGEEEQIDLILCIIDATNLQNGLRLVLELKQTGKPLMIALNMIDIAKRRGYNYDLQKLQQELNCHIVETTAIKKQGIAELVAVVDDLVPDLHASTCTWQAPDLSESRNYHARVAEILEDVKITQGTPSLCSQRIDTVLLHPFYGITILLAILFLLFQAVFSWAEVPKDMMQSGVDWLQAYVTGLFPNTLIGGLIGDGVIAGVGAVVVFLPQILIISLFVILLEDSGYMARAAFLMDRIMASCGLHGKAFIPILSSFACAIPGIMATRTIENRNDRLVTILVSPLTTCSARLPIYTLLISAFIPTTTVFGLFNLQGIVMFALFAIGIIFVLLVAFVLKFFFLRSGKQISIMELPSYKIPSIANVAMELIKPAKSFLRRAGTIIVAIMIVLWFLSTFPHAPIGATLPAIDYSFVGKIGHYLEFIFLPIGFNWQIVAALIPGMAAREIAVSALGTIYAISGNEEVVRQNLTLFLQHSWSLATALSLITWYIFAPQCISTLAVVKRETNSYKWPIIMFTYQIVLAYVMAFIVYRTVLLLGLHQF
ncbi:MAG: ferrous iron transporter B [Proteobacteria bacterium]|jgi:ferrous iron transport protein B|nr:ferrous iron transporter B [Pseudomonadota bacterium]